MKKRKRKVTEEERIANRAAIRREVERRQLNRKRLLVQRRPKGLLHIAKIHPNWDKPRIVAMGLAQEIFDFPSSGAREVGWVIERRWKDKRFLGKMLIALGKYLLKGKPIFDNLDIEIAKLLVRFNGRISIARMILELPVSFTGCNPDKKFKNMLKQRVKRLRRVIPGGLFGESVTEGQE